MHKIFASLALVALVAAPSLADPGNGKGGDKGSTAREPSGAAAHAGHGKPADPSTPRMDRGKPAAAAGPRAERGPPAARPDAARGRPDSARVNGTDDRAGGGAQRRAASGDGVRADWRRFDNRVALTGCPPGLAKKNNGCLPPGQPKRTPWGTDRSWWGIRGLRDLNGYRYYNGNLVRFGPSGSIQSYYPLLGGALSVGNVWPASYGPTALDPYYVNRYRLGSDYRYLDNTLYRLDPQTQAVTSIAALLTGDNFAVGSRVPAGYDVYNVPTGYRDRYVDSPEASYRYSDGQVYQVDPKTQLIVAALKLLI